MPIRDEMDIIKQILSLNMISMTDMIEKFFLSSSFMKMQVVNISESFLAGQHYEAYSVCYLAPGLSQEFRLKVAEHM